MRGVWGESDLLEEQQLKQRRRILERPETVRRNDGWVGMVEETKKKMKKKGFGSGNTSFPIGPASLAAPLEMTSHNAPEYTDLHTQAWPELLSRNIRHTAYWHHYSWCEFSRTQPRAASQKLTPPSPSPPHTHTSTPSPSMGPTSLTLYFFFSSSLFSTLRKVEPIRTAPGSLARRLIHCDLLDVRKDVNSFIPIMSTAVFTAW